MTYMNFIAGKWIGGSAARQTTVLNPADGSELERIALASRQDIDEALESAERGFRSWRDLSPFKRGQILRDTAQIIRSRQEKIARDLVIEQGKPLSEARFEVTISADILDWSAAEGERQYGRVIPSRDTGFFQTVVREPVGVSVLIPSWNVPVLFVARKLGECLAAGCSAILVGNKQVPGAAVNVVRAFEEAGLPADTINLLFGSNSDLVPTLLKDRRVSKVSFTGGTKTGHIIGRLASENVLKSTLELGGHAPAIVFDDVDIDATAEVLVRSKFRNAGQVCNSPTRFYIQRAAYAEFVERFADKARKLKAGNGLETDSDIGPLASAGQVERMEAFVSDAVGLGAHLLCGGQRLGNVGNFYEPTVLADIPEGARILSEEPFGPVAALIPFDDEDDMLLRANELPYGLAGYCYTTSMLRAHKVSRRLQVGMLGINTPQISLPETPFGGVKHSGIGSEGGTEGVAAYMVTKYVSHRVA